MLSAKRWPAHAHTVVVLGKRGVGKSSTLNQLFGFDRPTDAAVECTTAPYARRIHPESGGRYRIVDMPGIAANADSLVHYGRHYRRWLGKADTVVWITQANVRAFKQDQLFLQDYSAFVRPTTRLVLAISKADTQIEGLAEASVQQEDLLRRKAEDIVEQIVPYTWARREAVVVVPYSIVEDWNTELLRSAVLAI